MSKIDENTKNLLLKSCPDPKPFDLTKEQLEQLYKNMCEYFKIYSQENEQSKHTNKEPK